MLVRERERERGGGVKEENEYIQCSANEVTKQLKRVTELQTSNP